MYYLSDTVIGMKTLESAIASLKSEQEVTNFLCDLCTPGEIKDFRERWEIAQLLAKGTLSYRQVAEQANASITTVTRVARFLKDEHYQGYALIIDRLQTQRQRHQS
jgi:TrpR-related protein YerC/YecD